MGSIFLSEDMTLCQFMLPIEVAYSCLSSLGEIGKVYFRDLNPDVNVHARPFVNQIKRCEETEKQMRYLKKELTRYNIVIDEDRIPQPAPQAKELNEIELAVEKLERELREVCSNVETLTQNINDLTELKFLLEQTGKLLDSNDVDLHQNEYRDKDAIIPPGGEIRVDLGHLMGVIDTERVNGFERLIWRVSRGTAFVRHEDVDQVLEHPQTGLKLQKSVFIVFFQGEQLRGKMKKICEGFHASMFAIPDLAAERKEMLEGVRTRLDDLNMVFQQTKEHSEAVMQSCAKVLRHWMIKIRKTKSIYYIMNMFDYDVTNTLLVGEGWVPTADLDKVQEALNEGQSVSGCEVPPIMNKMDHSHLIPPTYFRTNKFTKIFQGIVNAYGTPTYKEANPALFSIITFPFLFSVMFGDAGDAVIYIIFAGLLIALEKKLMLRNNKDVFGMFFNGRYIILLMGIFSLYSGFIYNDIFSISCDIFGTAWYPSPSRYSLYSASGEMDGDLTNTPDFQLDPEAGTDYSGYPYPFGMDPVWSLSGNSITWLNSFKMKLSVLIGVTHMFFGLCCGMINHVRNRNYISIFCEFIPQVLFLACIFGYMNMLIVYKWFVYNGGDGKYGAACAPTILVDMIDMFLFQYPNASNPETACYSVTFYNDQKTVQTALIIVAVICVPWILVPKPLILNALHKKKVKKEKEEAAKQSVQNAPASTSAAGTAISVSVIDETHAASGKTTSVDVVVEKTKAIATDYGGHDNKGAEYEMTEITVKVDATDVADVKTAAAAAPDGRQVRTRAMKERPDEPPDEVFEFGEVFVHQTIHTIEYCLGCISHTASYLRLWALSLAHAELALVLWDMVLRFAFITDGYYGIITQFFLWPTWAVLTVAILLQMEGLSAFLHTLRLHWVEFQSKFYGGAGHPFRPFYFKKIIDALWEELADFA